MANRKQAQEFIINYIDRLMPGGENKALYEKLFSTMSDEDFDKFIIDLRDRNKRLSVICPNLSDKSKDSLSRNFKLAKELGHSFFQKVWVPEKNGIPSYLTPREFMVLTLPLRRQAQLLDKKISIPEDNNSIDNMTGQPTGKSKGSRISYPEVQVLAALNQDNALVEFLKYRGGDSRGFNAMNVMISRSGKVSRKALEPYAGTVKATHSLEVMLNCMHLKNNLSK